MQSRGGPGRFGCLCTTTRTSTRHIVLQFCAISTSPISAPVFVAVYTLVNVPACFSVAAPASLPVSTPDCTPAVVPCLLCLSHCVSAPAILPAFVSLSVPYCRLSCLCICLCSRPPPHPSVNLFPQSSLFQAWLSRRLIAKTVATANGLTRDSKAFRQKEQEYIDSAVKAFGTSRSASMGYLKATSPVRYPTQRCSQYRLQYRALRTQHCT